MRPARHSGRHANRPAWALAHRSPCSCLAHDSSAAAAGPKGFTPGAADYPSLAFDGLGTPFVAVSDGIAGGGASLLRFDAEAGAWAYVGEAGFSDGEWHRRREGDAARLACLRGGASPPPPARRSPPSPTAGPASWVDLMVDGSGRPHIAFSDGQRDGRASVWRYQQ